MLTKLRYFLSLGAAFLLGMLVLSLFNPAGKPAVTKPVAKTASVFSCAMHPQIQMPEMGQCPICFMDLIPVPKRDASQAENELVLVMGEAAVKLADIRTVKVTRQNKVKAVHLQGRIEYDETRIRQISAWLAGRIERKYVDYTGIMVQAGEHLVDIFSPTLIDAQENLLQTINSLARSRESELSLLRNTAQATYNDAREKLLLLGLKEDQIRLLERTQSIKDRVTIYSPSTGIVIEKHIKQGAYVKLGSPLYTIADLERVWLVADAYESDLSWLRYGQQVNFTVNAYPGVQFQGRISFISPSVDNISRTIKIRMNVDNPKLRLKPGMFATAQVLTQLTDQGLALVQNLAGVWICPMHREIARDQADDCDICGMELVSSESLGLVTDQLNPLAPLLIPHTAPLITGKRALVYVKTAAQKPSFEYREVVLGPRVEDYYVVLDGLAEGEEVVYHGSFKIDASRQILALPSMMSMSQQTEEASKASTPFFRRIDSLQNAYYQAQTLLASDASGKPAMAEFSNHLTGLPVATLNGEQRKILPAYVLPLQNALADYAHQASIEHERSAFHHVSAAFIKMLDYFGAVQPAFQYHCPMGPGQGGSTWIQAEREIHNPYMGVRMQKCGTFLVDLRESR